jgi:alkylation response protein AidB-like acyl-CoA dehydrogenase
MEKRKLLKSGEFLVAEIEAKDCFIPEEFSEEQLMMAKTCQDFLEAEVYPILDRIDAAEPGLMPGLLKKAGALGLLGVAIPEEYNGFGQSFVTQMLTSERIGAGYSFSVALMAHSGIGTLPITYYGNEDQRQRYTSKLATGEFIGSYCLTEPGAGSDANAGSTKAVPTPDGKHYILNGQKMWITNAGFADVHTVFAKIENDRVLSAFIVERKFPGVVVNPDEKKMGIKGSSTAQIFYNDVRVPAENLLGKRGEGFRIALTILQMGRIKLGGNVLGAARNGINDSVKYANERKQFNTLISKFGAIKFKLAEMVIRNFAAESAVYRVSRDVDDQIEINKSTGMDKGRASIEGISFYAVEAAILKVYSSEVLDYIADEAVQIHGGMGYSAELNVDRGYRDSRINRIFEGTNEINRLLVTDTIMKKGMKGDISLFTDAEKTYAGLDKITDSKVSGESYYQEKKRYLKNFKKAILLVLHAASEHFGKSFVDEQEVMNNIAEMIMELYASESAALRVEKIESIKGAAAAALYKDIINVNMYDTADKVRKSGQDAVNSLSGFADGVKLLKAISILTTVQGVNVKEARRRIADKIIEDNIYKF